LRIIQRNRAERNKVALPSDFFSIDLVQIKISKKTKKSESNFIDHQLRGYKLILKGKNSQANESTEPVNLKKEK